MFKYGFIGAGNMASALASGLVRNVPSNSVGMSDPTAVKLKVLTDKLSTVASTNEELAKSSNYVCLAVKPQVLPAVLPTLRGPLAENDNPVLVTMAAGTKTETICKLLGKEYPVIRIMPNTPCSIGAGVILVTGNHLVTEEQLHTFIYDFSACGKLVQVEKEEWIDSGSVISGCGPAYIYMYIEAMAKAGEALGLPYDTAAELAKATCRGAAMLSEQSPASLEDLRIAVCSPGGSTIEGVKSLQESDLNGTVEKALTAAYDRTLELAKDN